MLSEEEKQAIKTFKSYINAIDTFGTIDYKCINNLYEPVKIVLNLMVKLQKENKELKQENKRIKYFSSNLFIDDYIPKQVVKDKIKEIEEDKESYYYYWFLEERDIEKTINILEKILGDE